eukprot:TRINITY_DN5070_c1_g1_i1.p1 TRINITY_DN5070_c1_g1~~TRINITY_DN5070_c1_g1_i1.p1  ORF type:complete len:314 (+),score=36.29 TRINITY_DN5070_c1_g1_i1:105-1046(+)
MLTSHPCRVFQNLIDKRGYSLVKGIFGMDEGKLNQFHEHLEKSQHLCILTGAGVSADSGVPTFRGSVSWRGYDNSQLANPHAFRDDPSLVWEFYHWRRSILRKCSPNAAHYAIAAIEQKFNQCGKKFTLLTQNIDGLHLEAGSQNCYELHGSIWKVCRATSEGYRDNSKSPWEDRTYPLVPAFENKGDPDPKINSSNIPIEDLPHDAEGYLLRPGVVWYGEHLNEEVVEAADQTLHSCDAFISIGTSQMTYPAAGYLNMAQYRGIPVAEVNLEATGSIIRGLPNNFEFEGRAAQIVPIILGVEAEVQQMGQKR